VVWELLDKEITVEQLLQAVDIQVQAAAVAVLLDPMVVQQLAALVALV
jgi:hypothetical protein